MFRKHVREKGKISLTRYFAQFKNGEKVLLKAEPAVQRAIYHRRFHGRIGTIAGKQGNCYTVTIKDLNKSKTLIVHPVHLLKA